MSIKTLIVCWQDPVNKEWIPFGKLQNKNGLFQFSYVKGVKKAQQSAAFGWLEQMPDLNATYVSEELFPVFKNRLLAKTRPEYQQYLDWLGLPKGMTDLEELARTNGIKATDSIQLFEIPEPKQGRYEVCFFSHGIRYLPEHYVERIKQLENGERLFLMPDIQNIYDKNALLIRTDDPVELVGYCPRIYSQDISELINRNGSGDISLSVLRANADAPAQLKLLCKIEANWPAGFKAFNCVEFENYSA